MKMFRLSFTLLVASMLTCLCSSAQDFSNKGKEFWLAYSFHVGMINAGGPPTMTLYITSDVPTTYQVEIYGGAVIQSGSLAAGQVVTAVVPPAYFINDEGPFTKKAIHITAAKDVVVYAYITRAQASGATLCLPQPVLGKEYYSMNFTQVSNEANSNSYVTIVAVEDNTVVEITPSAATKKGWLANTSYTVNMNKGDIYQVLGALDADDPNSGVDLTGTHIRSIASGTSSCKKIAVFSGSGKVRIPKSCNLTSADNLFQQLYPTGSWGLKYLTAPSYNNPFNYYRVAKSNPAANVYVNGVLVPAASFTNGIWYEFSNNKPNLIQSDLPVCVAQYFTTQACSGNGAPYDPDMIILNPVEQNIDKVTLVSSNLYAPGEQDHHLEVIIPNGGTALSSFRLDGQPVSGWALHPGDKKYSYIYLAYVSQGYHTLSSDSGFNALAYGYATNESYGYSAGANVKDLYQFITVKNKYATVNFPGSCKNAPFNFSMTFPYQPTKVTWKFYGLFSDTTLLSPVYDSTWVVNGRQLYRYSLPGTYTAPGAGTYPVELLAQNPTSDGCSGEQQIDYDLQVYDPPTVDFSFAGNGCVTDSVHFTNTIQSGGRSIIRQSWDFADGNTASLSNPAHLYQQAGSYKVAYSVITDVGCISDTAQKIVGVSIAPVADFTIPSPACEDKLLTFTDQSSASTGPAIAKWTWTFGDGTPSVVATSNIAEQHLFVNFGANNASLIVETSSGCKSLPVIKPIMVHPNPFAMYNFTGACLPSGNTSFTDQSSIAAGNITQWAWDFGDGGSSAQQSPSHIYTNAGPFNVRLTVTSSDGCSDDSLMIMDKVYAQPVASFNAPDETCINSSITFTDQSNAAGNSVAGWLWNFGDGTTSAQQNPIKIFTTAGTYAVTLQATSTVGCLSTVFKKNITIDDLPHADFTITGNTCVKQAVSLTNTSTSTRGTITTWNWSFGDGTSSTLNTGTNFPHTYNTEGPYTITLNVQTEKGCASTIVSKPVTVHSTPIVNFGLPESCLSDPYSLFSDSSKIVDGTESLFSYHWDFGDPHAKTGNPNTGTARSPKHKYTATGLYNVAETVTSNNGCSATFTQSFFVNGSVPVSSFSVSATSICSGQELQITDHSSVNPGRVVRTEVYWDYTNDPSQKQTDENPIPGAAYSHTYAAFAAPASKIVKVRYVVYSGQTCAEYMDKQVTLTASPVLQFDPMPGICQNGSAFQVTQAKAVNGTAGTGIFSGQAISQAGIFTPASAVEGTHTIQYTYTSPNGCTNSITQTIEVYPVPVVDAGPDKFVSQGGEVELTPSINVNYPVTYLWTPATWLSNPEVQFPKSKAQADITYTLKVTSAKGCAASDQVFVKLLKSLQIPNIFSPNGDGIHDKWEIPSLSGYSGCTVDIYNRYGQLVFHSIGYDKPWDGIVNGNPVPVGTYYYIIDPKNGKQKLSGYVDVIR